MKSRIFAIGIATAIAIAAPGVGAAKVYADSGSWNSWQHGNTRVIHSGVSTSAQVVVHDSNAAPVLAAAVIGGILIASAIHSSAHCEQVVVAAPVCPPRYRDCDDWHDDWRYASHGHGRGHGHGRWEHRGRGRGCD